MGELIEQVDDVPNILHPAEMYPENAGSRVVIWLPFARSDHATLIASRPTG